MDKTHVVVTYYRKTPTSQPIMHAYGPYTEAEAKRGRRQLLSEPRPADGSVTEVSACRMWRPLED